MMAVETGDALVSRTTLAPRPNPATPVSDRRPGQRPIPLSDRPSTGSACLRRRKTKNNPKPKTKPKTKNKQPKTGEAVSSSVEAAASTTEAVTGAAEAM